MSILDKKNKNDYYSLKEILSYKATYNMIIGERSNGKTYAVLEHALRKYVKTGEQTAIIRRYEENFRGKRGQQMWSALVDNDLVINLTNGEWTSIYYYSGRWYLCRYENNKRITKEEPLAYAFALTSMESDKSTSYNNVTTVLFDEFLTRDIYLQDEFVIFCNVLSTIIRDRDNVEVFMLGNTVNKFCPYFKEMGLSHIREMEQGKIDIYRYGDSELTVAVEYCRQRAKEKKKSDKYFCFDNPKLNMVRNGAWELELYPHLPIKYRPKEILYTYFIMFDGDILQGEIIYVDDSLFTYIHRKTTDIKDYNYDMIYSTEYSPRPNRSRNILRPRNERERKIAEFYKFGKVFYQDNEVGEVVRNYIMWCASTN